MQELVSQTITALATLVLLSNIASIFLVLLLILRFVTKHPIIRKIHQFILDNATSFSLIVATVATLGSLFLSEIAKFDPCKLCWEQRIFMYPLPILFLVALITNDTKVKKYVLPIATIGLGFAIYHILLQTFPQALQCSDELISCTRKYTAHFGYITVPVMSASAFMFIIVLNLFRNPTK